VLLPPDTQPDPLALVSALERPGPYDDRYLGVPLDWWRLHALTGAAPVGRVLLLTWALALVAGALWLLDGLAWPRRDTAALLRVAGVVALLAVGLLAWASRDPFGMARALPLAPAPLAAATLTLAAGAAWRRAPAWAHWLPAVRPALLVVGGLLLAHLLLLLPLPLEWRGVAGLLVLALPGVLLAGLLFRHEREPLALAFLGLCGGLAVAALLLLVLHALPGPLPWWVVLLACDALSVALLVGLHRAHPAPVALASWLARPAAAVSPAAALLAVVLVGAVLRLVLLGNSEFQGDESRAILMAAGVYHGQDEILLLRPKGPVEVLIPTGLLVLTGQMNEWLARLPFALAGIGVLPGAYLLARRIFGSAAGGVAVPGAWVGALAAGILALDGFMLAFSRIVQYQSVILVMMLGALWCGWRFYEGAAPPWRYLLGAAVLAAVAMLSHYDGVFVLPALGWLALAGGWQRGWRGAQWARGLALPLLTGSGLLLAFYLPFVLNEHFGAATSDYLVYRLREGDYTSLSFNNLPLYGRLATFYGTTFQAGALALALLAGVVGWLLACSRPHPAARAGGVALVLLLLAGVAVLLVQPPAFNLSARINWAVLAFGLPLAWLALLPATPAALRVLVLWFAAPFVAMAFLIAEPRTHFYAMIPAAALLVALAVVQAVQWLRARRWRWALALLAGGSAALVLLALPYLYIAFLRPNPEYLRDFPRSRPAIYRASYGDRLPTDAGYFAFPQRDGWKVAGMLYRQGVLRGSYGSNKKPLITGWYARDVYRCGSDPAYFLRARSQSSLLPDGYDLSGYILVDHRRMMDIYSRAPVPHMPREFHLEDYAPAFDALPVASFPTQRFLFDVVPQHHLNATWQAGLRLNGLDMFTQPPADRALVVSLYWQPAQPLDPAYRLVAELVDEQGAVVGTAVPYCDSPPPADWPPGAITATALRLTWPPDLPPGAYRLRVGLRHATSNAWLPLADGSEHLTIDAPSLPIPAPGAP
jgi:4-amino-4-deoxy-L-arabinose transferase-like glycosyltransferase